MLQDKKGFTLIELLIIMVIIVTVSGIITPIAYKNVNKFKRLLKDKQEKDLEKEARYMSFIKDDICIIKEKKIVCNKDNNTTISKSNEPK